MDFLIAAITQRPLPDIAPDWPSLLDAANYHRLTPILAHATTHYPKPPHIEDALRASVRANAQQNLRLFAHTARMAAALEAQNIECIVLKGPALAHILYGDLSRRVCSDVDLMVRARDFTNAARIIATNGFAADVQIEEHTLQQHLRVQHDLAFAHADGTLLELHGDIAQPHYSYRTDLDQWFANARTIEIQHHAIRRLSSEHSLLLAIIHGTKHLWTRLDLLADVAALARLPLDWTQVHQELAHLGATRAGAVSAYLLRDFLGSPTNLLVNDSTALRISSVSARRLKDQRDPTYWQARVFDLAVRERVRDRIRYAGHALQRLKRPLK